ncbi:MAG: S9 family peptidase [Bacteroidota bacterium]
MKKLLPIWAWLMCSCLILSAQTESASWTLEHAMKFRRISGTTFSPDGKHVAYVVRTPVMEGEKSEYNSRIWVAATDGSMNVPYTHSESSSFAPAFSPDGKYLTFLSGRDDKTQIWNMRLMGGEAEAITKMEKGVSSFQWSPDGSRIAFRMTDLDSEEEKKAKKEKRAVILVDQNFKYSHLYSLSFDEDAEEMEVQRLTSGEFSVGSFDWSPDGSQIVFGHQNDPRINTGFLDVDISIVPADSGAVRSIVKQPGVDNNPKFSPDGTRIAFQSSGGTVERVGLADLATVSIKGGEIRYLPISRDRRVGLLDWSPDGSELYYNEADRTNRALFSIMANGGKRAALKHTPAKGVAGSVAMDKKAMQIAYVYETPDKPSELFVMNRKDNSSKQLSEVNADVEIPPMGKTEVISWKSKDGMEIEGILTYPVAYEQGKTYPLILQIHGGPAGVFSESFTGNASIYTTQFFAERGYAIIRPNPRGSTGYGKDFRYANVKDWGYGDYEDVMSGVDKVIEMGIGDENQMFVMGWSYGGYMTSFLVTRTGRFKAASMGAGLPNLISMTSTTDIPDYLVAHMGGKEFWDDYETYEKHSAMYHIKNVTTPTQVIHGANDLRVPTSQGQEFYVALSRRGIDTEMILLPRTPHGPREPKLLMEVSPRILKWFEQYKNQDPER